MLTSIATIATAVIAIFSAIGAAVVAIKKRADKKATDEIQSIPEKLKKPLTDAEREELQNALNDIANS